MVWIIDFRYHVVSLVSVLFALAVGIVIGAGPLQGRLGDTLTKQVSNLRKNTEQLNTQVRALNKTVDNQDAFAKGLYPELVTGRLSGRSVTLVRLPGSTNDMAKDINDVLTAAGAKVNGTVKVTKAWSDPTKKDFRDGLAKSLAPLARTDLPVGAAQDQGLADVLARGLVVTDLANADKHDSGSTAALQGLKTGGLIDYSGDGPALSTLAVVVAAPPTPGESDQVERDEATSYAVVTRALDAQSAGAVAASDPTGADSGGTLEALRSDDQASAVVSTVDDANQAMGLVTLIMAIREQLTNRAGQYGVGVGATKVVPDLTTP